MNPIDTSGVKPTVRVDTDRAGGSARSGGSSQDAGVKKGAQVLSEDTVNLTDTASRLSQLSEDVARADGIDSDRVEVIRQQIADGSYEIDAGRIAEALVQLERDLV